MRYAELDAAQQALMLHLVEIYVGRMRPDHAAVKMEEVRAHLADTWFAWIGGYEEHDTYYYQVYSPVILIEFDHQAGLALQRAGVDLTRTPLFLVLGRSHGGESALFRAARLDLPMQSAPSARLTPCPPNRRA